MEEIVATTKEELKKRRRSKLITEQSSFCQAKHRQDEIELSTLSGNHLVGCD